MNRKPWHTGIGPRDWRCEFCGCWSSNDYCFECQGTSSTATSKDGLGELAVETESG
jgi:hypothetical protein